MVRAGGPAGVAAGRRLPGRARPTASTSSTVSCAGFVLLLTPTGSLPSRRWRWWARVAAAAAVVFVLGRSSPPSRSTRSTRRSATRSASQRWPSRRWTRGSPYRPGRPAGAGGRSRGRWCGRFRRARGVERLQLRWLAWGATAGRDHAGRSRSPSWSAARRHRPVAGGDRRLPRLAASGHRGGDPALPAVRHGPHRQPHPGLRAAHACCSAPAMLSVVLGLGRLLPAESSSLVVAAATLAVAAIFQPARAARPGGGGPALQPPPLRRRPDHRRVRARLRDQVDLDAP